MQFQGKYCPLLLTAPLLSGLTQFISQIQIIISISLLLPFQSVTLTLLHCLTSQTAKAQHRGLVLCMGWILAPLVLGKPMSSEHTQMEGTAYSPRDAAQFLRVLKMCQLEVAQHRAWQGETGSFCTGANTLQGQAQCWGELGPAPLALLQHSSFIPSQQHSLGQVLLFSGPLLCRR